jgi:hypothetical protein
VSICREFAAVIRSSRANDENAIESKATFLVNELAARPRWSFLRSSAFANDIRLRPGTFESDSFERGAGRRDDDRPDALTTNGTGSSMFCKVNGSARRVCVGVMGTSDRESQRK